MALNEGGGINAEDTQKRIYQVSPRKQLNFIYESTAFDSLSADVRFKLVCWCGFSASVRFPLSQSQSAAESRSEQKYKPVFTKQLLKHQPGAKSDGWMLNSIDFSCLLTLKQLKSASGFKSLCPMTRQHRTGLLPHACKTVATKLAAWKWLHRYRRKKKKKKKSVFVL